MSLTTAKRQEPPPSSYYLKKILKHCCLLFSRKVTLSYRYPCLISVHLVICFLMFLWFLLGNLLRCRNFNFPLVFKLCYVLLARFEFAIVSKCGFFSSQNCICTSCKVKHHFKPVVWGAKCKSSKYNGFFQIAFENLYHVGGHQLWFKLVLCSEALPRFLYFGCSREG